MKNRTAKFIIGGFLGLSCSLLLAQQSPDVSSGISPEESAVPPNPEQAMLEDKAYTSFAICAGYYAVMVDEFRDLPQAPEVDSTIEAYLEAGEVSTMLATAFATVEYSAESIDGIVNSAISRETETLRAMIRKDVQLVGSLYDMICERMIEEAVTVLAG